MSFWSKVSDWFGPKIPPPVHRTAAVQLPPPTVPAALQGDGSFSLAVVGEAQYQNALDRVCGGRTRQGHNVVTVASLVLEDANPHDPKAVRVAIQGQTVGYLTRDKARKYRQRLADLGSVPAETTCHARIAGGWYRGSGDVGNYGVQLDVNLHKAARRGP